jgi:hypothetical protein
MQKDRADVIFYKYEVRKKKKKSKKQLVITSLRERDILQIDVIFSGLSSDGSVKVKHDYL